MVEVTVTSPAGAATSVYQVDIKHGDGFAHVDVGRDNLCAVRVDGTVDCWGPADSVDRKGIYQDVAGAGRNGRACGVLVDGRMRCWAKGAQGLVGDIFAADDVVDVSHWSAHPCWVKTDGSAQCQDLNSVSSNVPGPTSEGPYQSIAAGYYIACALTLDNLVVCLAGQGKHFATPEPETEFRMVEAGGDRVCAIRMDDPLLCWRHRNGDDGPAYPNLGYQLLSVPEGTFKSVSPAYHFICAVKTVDGSIVCEASGGRYAHMEDDVPDGEFVSVSSGNGGNYGIAGFACGLRTDGTVACWGDRPNEYRVPSMVSPRADDARLLSVKLYDPASDAEVHLSPRFNWNTADGYSAEVPREMASATVVPGATNRFAEVSISPVDADPDTDGHQVALDVGSNVIDVTVTSWDDSVELTYTMEIAWPNTAPVFAALDRSLFMPEHSPADTPVGSPVAATDGDGDPLTYTLAGTDAASFSIDASTGQIYTADGVFYDYESSPRTG